MDAMIRTGHRLRPASDSGTLIRHHAPDSLRSQETVRRVWRLVEQ
jgi:hypothetical protein